MPVDNIVTASPAIAVPVAANGEHLAISDYQHQGINQKGNKTQHRYRLAQYSFEIGLILF